MVSDAPNSSWHPAMMPNSIADLPRSLPQDTVSSPAQGHGTAEDTPQPDAAGEEAGAWFQDDSTGGDWLADTNTDNAPPSATEATEQSAPAEAPEDALPDESSTASKHFSTMSFTRTVPHEVNWNDDDDDAEWSLSRTNTDPFKFMPENIRTNSFPPVSPFKGEATETPRELEHPISFNPAEDLIREIEEEESREDEPLPDAATQTIEGDAASHQYLGGSSGAAPEEALEARFEEGVPLVSSAEQDMAQDGPDEAGHDLFAEEAAEEEDDFFNNVRADGPTEQDDFQPTPIQRKSTMDVMKSLDMGSASTTFMPLEETAEESETEGESSWPQETDGLPAQSSESPQDQPKAQNGENLDEKWKAMFGDEEDEEGFLPDEATGPNELDASAFLGSDDEGLLEDSETEQPEESKPVASPGYIPAPGLGTPAVNGQYLPHNQATSVATPSTNPYLPAASPVMPAHPYLPAAPVSAVQPPATTPYAVPSTAPPAPAQFGYGAPPPLQEKSKAQSFVDKKGGYTSPYDLPMEVVKPKRRTSALNLQSTSGPTSPAAMPPPPRSASMHSHPAPPSSAPGPGMARPTSSHSSQGPPSGRKPPQESFFEDLPMTTKARPASRHNQKSVPAAPTLVPAAPAVASTRYSPAPPGAPNANGPVPAPASSRYSPAPPASRQPSSGPLAHFEITHERSRPHGPVNHVEGSLAERRGSSSLHEHRLQRVPSLPPTREVEEEEAPAQAQASPGGPAPPHPMSPPVARYAPPPQGARQTPPPSTLSPQAMLSPPKRVMSSHSPLAPPYDFAPPPRSQTQSPGALYGNRGAKPVEPIPRPSSVNDPTSPRDTTYPAAPAAFAPAAPATAYGRPRGASLNLNVPRYGMNQSIPAVIRSPGEVKIQNIKDIIPLEERLSKFPGPLKGKSKKKETIAWLTAGIESLEQGLPTSFSLHTHLSHEDKRAVERVLLWKILRVFVEHDGVLEGNPAVEKAVRDTLTPGFEGSDSAAPYMNGGAAFGLNDSATTGLQSDGVSSSTVEQIRRHLLGGDCEKAIWTAADQRLWGHALLLSNALAPNLYRQVAQEFIKKEVNFSGHNNESLAALYGVLSGNHEESVDELVPSHARAGLQLVATNATSGPSKDAMEGLDKWRETLGLILSNRSTDDARAMNSLGVLLSGYGRAEAAHVCFMFARSHTVFGGLDDPASHFVLVGSDHKKQAEQFAKEIEPLLLSEVYEYGQSLAGSPSGVPVTNPHLAAYKLQHALALAEYGFRDKALQYCDAIAAAITSQTKRSPYHHPILENAVEDLMMRLKQAPKEETGSWIPKPTMNKVSDTVWSKFNKFVSGDDDGSGQGPPGEGEPGPFSRVAGGTPTISRSPSVSNLETFGAAVPSYGMPAALPNGPVPASAPPTRAASRYAPGAPQATGSSSRPSTSAYAPRPSMERTSSELNRGSFEVPRRSLEMQSGRTGSYSPARSGSPAAMYSPYGADFNSPQQSPYNPVSQPALPQAPASAPPPVGYPGAPVNGVSPGQESEAAGQSPETSGYQPPSYGYEPPSFTPYEAPAEEKNGASEEAPTGGSYEPPSYQPYGYEPPSYEPDTQPSNEDSGSGEESKPKPKKKGIMYDDEDDLPTPRPAEKSKEDKDRENAEMFRKAAEEDAKRAEAAKQGKKGWGFTSWFGGAKKDAAAPGAQQGGSSSNPNKPIRAKLGEANSFYYDPDLKRWVNKNAGPEDTAKKATPPPPRMGGAATPRSVSASPASPPFPSSDRGRASAPPPMGGPPRAASRPPTSASDTNLAPPSPGFGSLGGPPPPGPVAMLRSVSNTSTASAPPLGQGGAPPARPPTSLSNSSSIDDLLGAAGPRKPGAARKARKGARYVDVMGK
ncbi:Sec23-binding domain of Sec16-domain-containing protein [Parachaetomium inaequale]|uniref:Protein transport protein sec16 n=1 Tax=Parachaetomium inaequale TaxID=2588326 RepID=A0AAN6SWN0_9PEZI|nr:Sec23-binding domain of Sec16-domain-containing protein [Parachaetomium inaequale]